MIGSRADDVQSHALKLKIAAACVIELHTSSATTGKRHCKHRGQARRAVVLPGKAGAIDCAGNLKRIGARGYANIARQAALDIKAKLAQPGELERGIEAQLFADAGTKTGAVVAHSNNGILNLQYCVGESKLGSARDRVAVQVAVEFADDDAGLSLAVGNPAAHRATRVYAAAQALVCEGCVKIRDLESEAPRRSGQHHDLAAGGHLPSVTPYRQGANIDRLPLRDSRRR